MSMFRSTWSYQVNKKWFFDSDPNESDPNDSDPSDSDPNDDEFDPII